MPHLPGLSSEAPTYCPETHGTKFHWCQFPRTPSPPFWFLIDPEFAASPYPARCADMEPWYLFPVLPPGTSLFSCFPSSTRDLSYVLVHSVSIAHFLLSLEWNVPLVLLFQAQNLWTSVQMGSVTTCHSSSEDTQLEQIFLSASHTSDYRNRTWESK